MNKLTAEKCREQFENWLKEKCGVEDESLLRVGPVKETYFHSRIRDKWEAWQASREALEIALPILEQQERGCQKCGGTGMADSGGTQPWGEQILVECDCQFEQQERGEGEWLHWNGERALPPVDSLAWVEVKRRNGRLDQRQAQDFAWRNQPVKSGNDIIAYRIIPERATNQNGDD